MYGYRTILKIGDFQEASLENLLREGYELSSFSYTLSQPCDFKGKAQGEIQGGKLQLSIEYIPSSIVLEWMLNPRRYYNGIIVFYGEDNTSIMRIAFEKAICTAMQMQYTSKGEGFVKVSMEIHAKKLVFPEGTIENNWLNN